MHVINVYAPYCSFTNVDDFLSYLCKLGSMCDDINHPNLCFIGDFNASPSNSFGSFLTPFCVDFDLILSDYEYMPQESFTYVSDAHGSTTWLDHCLSSSSLHKSINSIEVLHQFISSDHKPLSVIFNCDRVTKLAAEDNLTKNKRNSVHWSRVNMESKYLYFKETEKALANISVPTELYSCDNCSCGNHNHVSLINNLYTDIVNALSFAACTIPKPDNLKGKNTPGWNSSVKEAHTEARSSYLNWISQGKPVNSVLYSTMRSTRRKFKYALRQCKTNQNRSKADALANSLKSDPSRKMFWKKVNSKKKSLPLPMSVQGVSDGAAIAEMWGTHYSSLFSDASNVSSNDTCGVKQQLSDEQSYFCSKDFFCSPSDLYRLLFKLQPNKSAGLDNISAEHLFYSDGRVYELLSVLFNSCIIHGVLPTQFLNTVITPVIKRSNLDPEVMNNYRPIAVASTVSKLFEYYILHHIEKFLISHDNQFGFKPNHSTDMSVFLLKQMISHYVNKGSPVYALFLDSSKAFDRVNHDLLFKKLIERNVPMCFVRLLCFWYKQQSIVVRWGNHFSKPFTTSSGVRQGGILSPLLFSVYMDGLSDELNCMNIGCYAGNFCINHIMFADDLCCICPSIKGLQKLVNVCENYACRHDILF